MSELDDNADRLKRSLEETLAHLEGRPNRVRLSRIGRVDEINDGRTDVSPTSGRRRLE